ncbi:MAG: RnfABCDGE type electron transport complex subunit D, partial [Anaerococcus sp.]|nr:RnfABCDGE type electron transport complex subunit D [Anaerococcus sp.]
MGVNVDILIIIMGLIAIIYSYSGGLKSVLWTDFIQGSVLLIGVTFGLIYLVSHINGGMGAINHELFTNNKFLAVDQPIFDANILRDSVFLLIFGAGINTIGSYVSSQDIVQRFTTTNDSKQLRKMMIGNGCLSIFIATVFYLIGTGLYVFYQVQGNPLPPNAQQDQIFASWIAYELPVGVTGILLAFNVPFTLPVWQLVIGAVFAIVVVKMAFGGIGQNIVNPALAARAFLLASWSSTMTTFVPPQRVATLKSVSTISALSAATPLSEPASYSVMDLFLGNIPGSLGEVSALALIIGFIYLLIRGVVNIKMPLIYIVTATVLGGLFQGFDDILKYILSGGMFLGAFFMLTDYTTSPVTPNG